MCIENAALYDFRGMVLGTVLFIRSDNFLNISVPLNLIEFTLILRKSVTHHYYRGANAVVLVYDVTNQGQRFGQAFMA